MGAKSGETRYPAAMAHDHSHDTAAMSDRRLLIAIVINVGLTVAQIVGGVLSGSLALVADALHNFSDAASLGIAWFARKIGRRPADQLMTFGWQRAELVAALVNLTSLVIIGFYLLVEAVARLTDPQPVAGWTVMWVAGIALVVDVVTALMLRAGAKGNLNMKAAFLHNVSDALASLGVIAAGAVILLYDWWWADLLVTGVIAGLVLWQGVSLLPRTARLLMGAVPDDVEFAALVKELEEVPGVAGLHHVHVWSLDEDRRALEAHLVPDTASLTEFEDTKARARTMLAARFAIGHATLEPCIGEACRAVETAEDHDHPDHAHY